MWSFFSNKTVIWEQQHLDLGFAEARKKPIYALEKRRR
jgi:hypothetical protein